LAGRSLIDRLHQAKRRCRPQGLHRRFACLV